MTRLRPQIHNGLHWVRGELDQSLTRARTLIEGYAESPKDVLPLQQAYVELHQVRGTASMIQCYGIAAAAEEMKQTVHELMHGKLGEPELAYSVLLGASAQLADYIEAIDSGMDDCALVLQPMINELRLVRSKSVLTEADLFVAQLQSLNLALPAPDSDTRLPGAAREQAQKLLPLFQQSLLHWFREGQDSMSAVARMGRIGEQISLHTRSAPLFLLWRSFAACAEALLQNAAEDSLELKRLFGAAGRQIKLLAEQDEDAAAAQLDTLPYQLLFHVGRSRGQGPRVAGLRKVFSLSMYLPETAQLEVLRRKIKGPNVTLLTKVADEIRIDLTQIKDGIDLAVRGGAGAATLKDTRGRLKRIADTLSVLGLPVLQRVIGSQVEILDALPLDRPVSSAVWMDLATAILRVESSLEGALFRTLIQKSLEHPAGAPELEEATPPPRDVREGRKALLREQLVNLSRFKTGVDALIRNNDPSQLGEAAQMLAEIRAGFGMLESARAAELIGVLERHVRSPGFAQMRESKERADRFADAIACVEYYLEGVRDELPDVERMLDDLAGFIALLDVDLHVEPPMARTVVDDIPAPAAAPEPAPAIVLAPPATVPDEVDPEIREVFVEEAGEVQSVLEKALPRWTRDVGDRATLTDIRRAFHTLKGSGRMVGATDIGEFGWAFESLLNRCLDGAIPTGQPVVELVQQAVALLPTLIAGFRDQQPTDSRLAPLRERAKVLSAGLSGTAADPEMVAVFREDAVERLASIKNWLAAQDRSRADFAVDDETVRSFHTLRGSAALVKASSIHELAGQAENYLDAVRESGQRLPAASLDLLEEIGTAFEEWVAQVGSADAAQPSLAPWTERLQKLQEALPQQAEQSASDRELHEIFAGEAFELVQKMEQHAAAWAAAPANRHPPSELKMLAHTLRGAALMSGCAPIADVALALGDRISEALTQSANPDPAFFRHLAEVFENLYQFLDSYREGTLGADGSEVAQRVAAVEFVGSDMLPPAIPPAPVPAPAAAAAPPVVLQPPAASIISAAPELAAIGSAEFEAEVEPSPELMELLRPIDMPDVFPTDAAPVPPAAAAESPMQPEPPEPLDESLAVPLFESPPEAIAETLAVVPAPETEMAPVFAFTEAPPPPQSPPELPPLVAEANEPPDPELLGIFLAEAQELLENFDTYSAAWEAHPDAAEPPVGLKRVLHTLKGSARMAGMQDVGQLAQRLESAVVDMTRRGAEPDAAFFTRMRHAADGLHQGLDSIGRGGSANFLAVLAEFEASLHAPEPAWVAPPPVIAGSEPAATVLEFADQARTHAEQPPPPTEQEPLFEPTFEPASEPAFESAPEPALELASEPPAETAPGFAPEAPAEPAFEATFEADAAAAPAADATAEPEWAPPPAAPVSETLVDLTQTLTPGSRFAAATDADLIETFRAEATELLEALTDALDAWQSNPQDEQPRRDIQHALHTLKGGARMSGLLAMGTAAHDMEERIEAIERRHAVADGELFARLRSDLEQLQAMQDLLLRGTIDMLLDEDYHLPATAAAEPVEAAEISAPEPAPPAPAYTVAELADEETPAAAEPDTEFAQAPDAGIALPQPERDAAPVDYGPWNPELFWKPQQASAGQMAMRRETARVPVEQLDSLLNQAGEISIYRSRLEEHNTGIGAQLNEMTAAIQRVREQLRLMDIETDAQIEARGLSTADTKDRYEAEFDPLEMDRYTRMQELSRALSESVGDLANLRATMDELVSEAETLLLQQGRINTQVQQGLMSTLMVPFSRQAARLQRVLKQTAQEEGKQAEIVFEGIDSELDRNVLERMTAPLEHLLRNAVVHGIETPATRRASGKPEQGTVQLSLRREGTQLLIELRDDGRGLDLPAIRAQAVRRGLLAADAQIADDALAQFIFEPGFSTAKALTQAAGRGIGMDVVASEVKQLGGTLELGSQTGRGARFVIRLPLNLAMSQTLLVKAGGETYAIPLSSIEGIARIPRARLEQLYAEDGPPFPYGGNEYRVRHLADFVGLKSELDSDQKSVSAILVRMAEGLGAHERRVAVVVDQLIGNREIVTKPVGPQVSSVAGVTGATILADGRVLLIMDLQALTADRTRRSVITVAPQAEPLVPAVNEAAEEAANNLIMVVDDSITIRRVTERLLVKNGYRVVTAKDGLDAMAQLQTESPAVVLLDIEMPRADGFEVATFIRNNERIARTPIIMITSRSGEKHRERARGIGVNRYVIKPYQEEQLIQEIHRVTDDPETVDV